MADKNYAKGILLKEVGEYGKLKVSIKVDEFVEFIRSIESNGWANLEIGKNRQPTEKGYTHHCYENTFKPDPNYNQQNSGANSQYGNETVPMPENPEDSVPLPF